MIKKNIAIILQTGKDRTRYLDITFNSLIKCIPSDVKVYIACDTPDVVMYEYLTTSNTIRLLDSYHFPNDNPSWQACAGFIPNKTEIKGIHTKYYKLLLQEKDKHRYKKLCSTLYEVASSNELSYLLYIEDDVIFKHNFYSKVLECIDFAEGKNIGRIAVYNRPKNLKGDIIQFDNDACKSTNQCLLLNCDILRKLNLDKYQFDFDDLPPIVQERARADFLPQTGADVFFAKLVNSMSTNYSYTHEGVCQHIGVLSSLYKNVEYSSDWSLATGMRCFFDSYNNALRVDLTVCPPFLL